MKRFRLFTLSIWIAFICALWPIRAFAEGTDLEIRPETITQMEYTTAALTDRYDIRVLTEDAYEQARLIAEQQERAYFAAQAALFSGDESVAAVPLEQTVARLGMFGDSYAALNIASQDKQAGYSFWLMAGMLVMGSLAGCGLALVLQKRKRSARK